MASIEKTLHELGNGVFAYTQLPGSWGWSNSGLITDGGQSLLIDTLFDEKITAEMLATMRRATPAAERIGTVVNTHGNGDHCYGNTLVADAEIIGTEGCVQDLREAPPSRNRMLLRAATGIRSLGAGGRLLGRALGAIGLKQVSYLADTGEFAQKHFANFDFAIDKIVPPNRVFSGELDITVGDKKVQIIEVGPAHTRGDAVVYLPQERTLFTGDILFKDAHPIIWNGPVSNWIDACKRLLAMDIDTVVPGHGPITDKSGLREIQQYLELLTDEARGRYDAGMSVEEAARDISLAEFDHWMDAERLYANLCVLYRDFRGDTEVDDVLEVMAGIARLDKELSQARAIS
jgi:glyoxylase-like metal-dependent hydrolase (beta-lactamase superfamily II)